MFSLLLLLLPIISFATDPASVIPPNNAASTCAEKKVFPHADMRSAFGPLRNQGDSTWCYAYAATDLANYWLKKHRGIDTSKKENQISAAALALKNEAGNRADILSLSQVNELSKMQTNARMVTPDRVTNQFFDYYSAGIVGNPARLYKSILEEGYCTENEVSTIDAAESYKLTREITKLGVNPAKASICETQGAASQLFPQSSFNDIKQALLRASEHQGDANTELLYKSCTHKKVLEPLPLNKSILGWNKNEIKNQLSKENPVTIALDQKIFYMDQGSVLDPQTSIESNHIVTLVGQRFNCETKQAEYIIRNSYGSDFCNRLKTDIHPTNLKRKSTVTCENGYFIIPEAVLEKATVRATYLDGN